MSDVVGDESGVRYAVPGPRFEAPKLVGGSGAAVAEAADGFVCPVRGTVTVVIAMDRGGAVRAQRVARGVHAACNGRALAAVERLSFRPAQLYGEPVSMRHGFPVGFE